MFPAVIKTSPIRDHIVPLRGGLDQKTPTLMLPPGYCRDACNFEVEPTGGYTRVEGYERFDGQVSPSAATYSIVQVTSFTNTPTVGQTLTGGASGATGQIVALGSNYMALTLITGSFTTTEAVAVGATAIGTATPQTVTITSLLNAQYLNLSADVYRLLIAAVPGSGRIRGLVSAVFSAVHILYAFRDNAGATALALYKSSASGWTLVPFNNEISFTAGAVAIPADGATLTQGAVTATVLRVMLQTGVWTGAGAGRLIIGAPAGGNFAAGAATLTGGATCTLSGVQTAITMLPGGKMDFDLVNFAGQAVTKRIYGSDGVNRCFEFDGTTLCPIATGFSPDVPVYIKGHKNHLFIGIGSSIANSGIGTPFNWSTTAGGSEIAVGDTVTGMKVLPGSQASPAMLVSTKKQLHVLYGTASGGTNPWTLNSNNTQTGALPYSLQNLDKTYMLGAQGVVSLETTQMFGNFVHATLTAHIQTLIAAKRSLLVYSSVSKDRSQYRLFFSDGTGLYLTVVTGKFLGAMPVLLAHTPSVAWESENASGDAVSYFGDLTGYVHQMGKGSSFDGANIDAYMLLNWDNIKSPRIVKRYHKASLEIQSNYYAKFTFGYQLGYGTTEIDQPNPIDYASNFSGSSNWDSVSYDKFTWDGSTLSPSEVGMDGRAENFQARIHSTDDYIYPFTVNSAVIAYSNGRRLR